jgi:MFS family permease
MFFSMAAGVYLAFINVYLYDLGFSTMQIGIVSAIVPVAALGLQLVFGVIADRVKLKNSVALLLLVLLIVTAGLFLLFRRREDIIKIVLLMSVWTGVHAGLLSISTAIILENMQRYGHEGRFGRVRLSYSLGYAAATGSLGWLFNRSIVWIFPACMVFAMLALVPLLAMPKSLGKPDSGVHVPWYRIFTYKRMMSLLGIALLLCVSNGFVYTFMPVYFMQVGGNNELYGYAVLLMTVALIAASVWSIFHIKLDAIPDLSDVQVIIIADAEGQNPETIDKQVTYPLASAMMGVPRATAKAVTTP